MIYTEIVASWSSAHTCEKEDDEQYAAKITEFSSPADRLEILGGIDFLSVSIDSKRDLI